MCAVVSVPEVGVDVEAHSDVEMFDLAQLLFTPLEQDILGQLAPEERPDAFFRLWTCKEAFVKAVGTGVAFGLDRVEVSIPRGEAASMLRVHGDEHARNRWTLQELSVAPLYAAAVAVHGSGRRARCLHFET